MVMTPSFSYLVAQRLLFLGDSTGKERDAETGLDYFLARYYSGAQGRFLSPDIAGPRLDDPQSFNKYNYTRNNPLKRIDPDGLYDRDVHYDLTRVIAYAAGYTALEGILIGSYDQGVDDDPNTSPKMDAMINSEDLIVNGMWHFPSRERVDQLRETAYRSSSLNDIGRYLHVFQDSLPHAGYDPAFGHARSFKKPDHTWKNHYKANMMAEQTYNYLVLMNNKPAHTPVPFKVIYPYINEFNKESDTNDKLRVLSTMEEEIEKYLSRYGDRNPGSGMSKDYFYK